MESAVWRNRCFLGLWIQVRDYGTWNPCIFSKIEGRGQN